MIGSILTIWKQKRRGKGALEPLHVTSSKEQVTFVGSQRERSRRVFHFFRFCASRISTSLRLSTPAKCTRIGRRDHYRSARSHSTDVLFSRDEVTFVTRHSLVSKERHRAAVHTIHMNCRSPRLQHVSLSIYLSFASSFSAPPLPFSSSPVSLTRTTTRRRAAPNRRGPLMQVPLVRKRLTTAALTPGRHFYWASFTKTRKWERLGSCLTFSRYVCACVFRFCPRLSLFGFASDEL